MKLHMLGTTSGQRATPPWQSQHEGVPLASQLVPSKHTCWLPVAVELSHGHDPDAKATGGDGGGDGGGAAGGELVQQPSHTEGSTQPRMLAALLTASHDISSDGNSAPHVMDALPERSQTCEQGAERLVAAVIRARATRATMLSVDGMEGSGRWMVATAVAGPPSFRSPRGLHDGLATGRNHKDSTPDFGLGVL